jgi:hypothetical protein
LPKLHTLDFRNFVQSVTPETIERYFVSLSPENVPAGWATLNGDVLEEFLEQPENAQLNAAVRQDFRRVSDLATRGPGLLFDSYDRHQVDFDHTSSPEELALRAFLDERSVWDFAWSRFLLFALDSKVSVYAFPACSPEFGADRSAAFRMAVSESFLHQAKGHECDVQAFTLDREEIVYIKRGYYIRTASRWQAEEVEILSYRPALEDVIAFDTVTNQLTVKAAQQREREDYVRLFAHHFAGDLMLGEQALKSRTFDLTPIATQKFNYRGNGKVVRVELVGIKLKLPFKGRSTLRLDSTNMFETLASLGLAIELGELVSAKLRFHIAEGKDVRRVTFELAPPSRTDLGETAYKSLIDSYLKSQGVRLF